jgi:ribosomal protein L24
MHMPLPLVALLKKQSKITISGVQFDTKHTSKSTTHEHPVKQTLLTASIS